MQQSFLLCIAFEQGWHTAKQAVDLIEFGSSGSPYGHVSVSNAQSMQRVSCLFDKFMQHALHAKILTEPEVNHRPNLDLSVCAAGSIRLLLTSFEQRLGQRMQRLLRALGKPSKESTRRRTRLFGPSRSLGCEEISKNSARIL